jgi:hypothetical protein
LGAEVDTGNQEIMQGKSPALTGNVFNPFFSNQEGGTFHGDVCPKSTPLRPAGRASARSDATPEDREMVMAAMTSLQNALNEAFNRAAQ